MDHTLYLIPGVASDRRIFRALQEELAHIRTKTIDWIAPKRGESIRAYAKRLAEQIVPEDNPVLVGYSFGGLVAIEMSKLLDPTATILISSIKSVREKSNNMVLTKSLGLNRLIPTSFGKKFGFAYKWISGPETEDDHAFVETMAKDLCDRHTDWAIHQALHWRHRHNLDNLYHIHGEKDRVFPIKYIENCIRVEGGTHLMVLNKPKIVGKHIEDILADIRKPV